MLLRSRTTDGIRPQEAYRELAQHFELSEADLAPTVARGESHWENSVRWARSDLNDAGLLDRSQHGVWKLSQASSSVTPDFDSEPTTDLQELDRRAANLRQRGEVPLPRGHLTPQTVTSEGTTYLRDPRVKAWVLQMARGQCDLCNNPGPFLLATGEPYLEEHHVLPLAQGGSDTVQNAVAVCPNCHRRLHLGTDASQQREILYRNIGRLLRP